MSARNYLSAREKSINKFIDSLPVINSQKFNYRSQELPALSANKSNLLNRNLNYSYEVPYGLSSAERATTPFSDFFSESETGTSNIFIKHSMFGFTHLGHSYKICIMKIWDLIRPQKYSP